MTTIHFPDSYTEDRFNTSWQEFDDMHEDYDTQLDEQDIELIEETPANNVAAGDLSPDTRLKHSIIINDLAFPSIKHAFWALLIKGDREDRRTISNIASGALLSRRMWNEPKHANWSALRFPVMGICVHLAIRNNPDMQKALRHLQDEGLTYDPTWKDEFFADKGNYVGILKKLRDSKLHKSTTLVATEISALKQLGVDITDWAPFDTTVWTACIWSAADGEHKILTTPELSTKWLKGGASSPEENRRIEDTRTVPFQDPYEMRITKGITTSRWIGEKKEMHTLAYDWMKKNNAHVFVVRRQTQLRTDDGKVLVMEKFTG